MAPPADLEPFSLFSHFRHHSGTHLTAPLARRSSAIAGAVQSHQATFLLTASPQRDIFISSSDKYISLRERNYEEKDNLAIYLGAICALLAAISSWYTIAFNDSRFIVPMDLIISGTLLALYIVYLAVLFFQSTSANKRRGSTSRSTRTVNPKLGFLGLFGFAGFLGFWTYRVDQTIFPFVFFVFFGFFGFFYEGKMSNTLIDERYKENKMRAQSTANKTALSIIFLQY